MMSSTGLTASLNKVAIKILKVGIDYIFSWLSLYYLAIAFINSFNL